MTMEEFLSAMKSHGATFAPAAADGAIMLTNTALQNMRAAMLPMFMIDLYRKTGGIILGGGYIFGPSEIPQGSRHSAPDIVRVNSEISGIANMRGKTVFGRNDLFWFAFDSFGTCFMLNNLTLNPMKKYDDPLRALTDCLIAGKI